MKKKLLMTGLTFLFMFFSHWLYAQVGINTDGSQPDPSAMLDVKSAVKGFLPPRVALTSLHTTAPVASPVAVGLLVYNTATNGDAPANVVPGYYYWNGGRWVAVTPPSGVNPGEMLFWNGSAWVTIPGGTHGQKLSFCDGVPVWGGCFALVTTVPVANITQSGADCGGDVPSDGGSPVIERGVCWSTSPNPTTEDDKISDGTGPGAFVVHIEGLDPSSTYYVRAYATNDAGTSYGNEEAFSTGAYYGAPVTRIPLLSTCPNSSTNIPITVTDFINIGAISLTLQYNSSALTYVGSSNSSGYPGLSFNGTVPGEVTITGFATQGVTYPDYTVLFTLEFAYVSGMTELNWYDDGTSCQYRDGGQEVLNDQPTASYYINGYVSERSEVGIPIFADGAISARCQGMATYAYTATAANSTGMLYSLDAISTAAGNSIDTNTGEVNYTASWTGTSVITASADGCNGPKYSEHTVTIHPLLPVSILVTESANPVCTGTQVTFNTTPVNGGTAPLYQWSVCGTNVPGATNASFAYVPADDDAIKCMMTSDVTCPGGNPVTSNLVIMEVNPPVTVGVSIAESVNPVCPGTNVMFTATPVNGGTSPQYQWKLNGTDIPGATSASYSYIPVNGDYLNCVLTSNANCSSGNPATSNNVTMTVNSQVPVSVSIVASDNPVCYGTLVTYTATPVNGGTNPTYQWLMNNISIPGATNATYQVIPVNGDQLKCVLTSTAACPTGNPATSNIISMGVTPLLAVGSIGSDQSIGENTTPAELIGVPPLNGTSPVYQMQHSTDNISFSDINGATTLNYQPGSLAVTTYYRQVQNASGVCGGPLMTNVVTITVNPYVEADVTIDANPTEAMCAGTDIAFTAIPVNGGTTPAYQWKVNGNNTGIDSPSFIYAPQNGDEVKCVMTSSLVYVTNNPANSNIIPMSVIPVPDPASVSIAALPAGPVCAGTQVVYTATPVNGGASPTYQWKVNGVNAGTNSSEYTYVPVNGDVVVCHLTSNEACASEIPAVSNEKTMTVNPVLPVSISVSPSDNPVCAGTGVTYTSSVTNGGTTPSYQWKVNGIAVSGATDATYLYVPADNDAVTCILTSCETCTTNNPATSNSINMIVDPILPVTITIYPSANPSCAGASVLFSSNIDNGGSPPAYQWKLNGSPIGGATNSTYSYVPADGHAISCVLTSNATCSTGSPATSNVENMTVNPVVPVSVSITASVYAVMPGTQVTYTANPVNGGTSPSYQWKVNGASVGTNSDTYAYNPNNGDKVTCVMTSGHSSNCLSNNPATSNKLTMIVYTTGTPCNGLPTVSYGGLTYNTVQIGTQCWMRENLNIGTRISNTVVQTNNAVIEKYCYNDSTLNCDVYGGLYQWNELMQYVTTQGAQGICPSGWHVPTEDEFITLATYVGGAPVAGGKLKEAGTLHFRPPNTSATNEFGFTALPSGYSYNNSIFSNIYQTGYFYTSTDSQPSGVVFRSVSLSVASLGTYFNYKTTGNPVRCLKN
ncbi:MAG: FISUMP domain-containing protein [Bacteroidales bacterium]|nr:FISUMP domain-containing protein [Bacteroidales bacterium]